MIGRVSGPEQTKHTCRVVGCAAMRGTLPGLFGPGAGTVGEDLFGVTYERQRLFVAFDVQRAGGTDTWGVEGKAGHGGSQDTGIGGECLGIVLRLGKVPADELSCADLSWSY